jgi:hypothetical protein
LEACHKAPSLQRESLAVFGDFARVGIKGIAMQGVLFQSGFDDTGIYGIAMQCMLF